MSYTPSDTPRIALDGHSPQAVFLLDTGELVAVAFEHARTAHQSVACIATAWQVEPDGTATAVDDDDGVVRVALAYNADVSMVARLGIAGIANAMRDVLLGEPQPAPDIKWGASLRAQSNIRNAIAVALAMGELVDWGAQ